MSLTYHSSSVASLTAKAYCVIERQKLDLKTESEQQAEQITALKALVEEAYDEGNNLPDARFRQFGDCYAESKVKPKLNMQSTRICSSCDVLNVGLSDPCYKCGNVPKLKEG